jgi:hypothetical protein
VEKKVFTVVVEYSRVQWQDLCIYDIACGKTVNEFLLPRSNFDPTTGT